jgi:hypothetical protein
MTPLRSTISTFRVFGLALVASVSLASAACGSPDITEDSAVVSQATAPSPVVDPRRSLAITEQRVLANFSLKRVFDQLVTGSEVPGLTSLELFQQWWDTQNPSPGRGAGPHCDDEGADGISMLNGYPYTCRPTPAEGAQASCDPFSDPNSPCAYVPIGLFMRFDLAPESGTHCGEYRIVYAKASGLRSSTDRNLIIFEAALRNPHYNQGLRGCEKFVRAFAELSNEPNIDKRRAKLETFYFSGYQEFDPIVSYTNFGDNNYGTGQVRTNQFMQPVSPRIWSLREFKLRTSCSEGTCNVRFVPVTNKVNPFGPLFDPSSTSPKSSAFQLDFLGRVARLAAPSLEGLGMSMDDAFNSAQGQENGSTEGNYLVHFGNYASNFRDSIQSSLSAIGSELTPDEVVARAQAMSCAGCHRLSNNVALGGGLVWPTSLGFTHVSERDVDLEVVDGLTRYAISPALTNAFLPHRKAIVENFLNDVPRPAKPPNDPIGGRFTH